MSHFSLQSHVELFIMSHCVLSFELQMGSSIILGSQTGVGLTDTLPAEIREVCLFCENKSAKATLDLSVVKGNQRV